MQRSWKSTVQRSWKSKIQGSWKSTVLDVIFCQNVANHRYFYFDRFHALKACRIQLRWHLKNKLKWQGDTLRKNGRWSYTGTVSFVQKPFTDKAELASALTWWRIQNSLCWMSHGKYDDKMSLSIHVYSVTVWILKGRFSQINWQIIWMFVSVFWVAGSSRERIVFNRFSSPF